MLHLIPDQPQSTRDVRYQQDKDCFQHGKDDAVLKQNRDSSVYYDERDKDCYDMGYSAGEIE